MKTTQLLDFKLSKSIYAMKNTSKMLLFFKLKLSDINLCNKNWSDQYAVKWYARFRYVKINNSHFVSWTAVTPLIDIWGVDLWANQIDFMHASGPKGTIFGKPCISAKKTTKCTLNQSFFGRFWKTFFLNPHFQLCWVHSSGQTEQKNSNLATISKKLEKHPWKK